MRASKLKLQAVGFGLVTALFGAGCSRRSNNTPSPAGSAQASVSSSAGAKSRPNRKVDLAQAKNTREILKMMDDECLSCSEQNGCLDPAMQGGVCETVEGKPKKGDLSEAALCLETLRCVFGSKCIRSGLQMECVCGKIDPMECMTGKKEPVGTCVGLYRDDFGTDARTMLASFVDMNLGAGRANAIAQCATTFCPTCRMP